MYMLLGFMAAMDSGLNVADSVLTLAQMSLGVDWGFWQPNPRDGPLKIWHGLSAMTGRAFAVPFCSNLAKQMLFWFDKLTFGAMKVKPPARLRMFFWLIQAVEMVSLLTAADMAYGDESKFTVSASPHRLTAEAFRREAIRAMYLTMVSVSGMGYGDESWWTDAGKYAALPLTAVAQEAFNAFQESLGTSDTDEVLGDSIDVLAPLMECDLFSTSKTAEFDEALASAGVKVDGE
jgi:hypothetical protein